MPSDATEAALGLLGLTGTFPSPSPSTIPAKRKQPATVDPRKDTDASSSESVFCICGFDYDDGFSIGCDSCSRWCHAACFSIVENEVPDEWQCWECAPRPVDRDRAVKLQRARYRQMAASGVHKQRRASPGVERKPRKPSAAAGEGAHKRKRRASINTSVATHTPAPAEDEHVDIDEPIVQSYVPIVKDIVTDDARDRLRRVASDWRGITAISPTTLTPGCTTPALLAPDDAPGPLQIPHIAVQPVPTSAASFPSIFANGNASVRPPSYAIHAIQPITSSKFIAPYSSTIIPTASYLRDPLNAYAHLGMPKPYVHLFGPPLDVALDARITGDQCRFVRNGCRPNAILRPMFCPSKERAKSGDDAVKFGIFALRDLKANEEVVLGWEWDDENVVHHLPALIQSPFAFPPHQVQHFRNQMTSMLHTLASTFTTCACGAKARDCVLTRIAEFVENQTPLTPSPSPPSQFTKEKHGVHVREKFEQAESPVDLGPLIGIERGFRTRERIPFSGGMGGVELVPPSPSEAGPSRLPSGVRKVSFPDNLLNSSTKGKGKDSKGKGRAMDVHDETDQDGSRARSRARRHSEGSSEPMDVDVPPSEARLPPRLRKSWIAKSVERLRERSATRDSNVDMPSPGLSEGSGRSRTSSGPGRDESYFDSRDMPPPPVPPSRTPPLASSTNHTLHAPPISASSSSSSTSSSSSKLRLPPDGQGSPSIPFSKLSLLSPVIPLPTHTSRSDSQTPPTPASSSAPSVAASSSKSTVKKPRRPTLSPQPPPTPDAEKPPKNRPKAKTKEKNTAKDSVKVRAKEKGKESEMGESTTTRKTARPRTPVTETEPDEPLVPVLKPSLLRREDVVKRRKSSSPVVNSPRSPATALKSSLSPAAAPPKSLAPISTSALAISVSPPPPPSTSAAVEPDLPPEPPDAVGKFDGVPKDRNKDQAMEVDEQPPPPATSPSMLTVAPLATQSSAAPDLLQILAAAASTVPTAPSAHPPSLLLPHVGSPAQEVPAVEVAKSPVAPEPAALPLPVVDPEPKFEPQFEPALFPESDAPVPAADAHPPEPAPTPAPATSALELFDDPPTSEPPVRPEFTNPPPESPAPEHTPSVSEHGSEHEHEHEHEPESGPEPKAPPPPPKVKLSLKDFAMRKKKQREEREKELEKEHLEKEREREKEESEHAVSATQSPAIGGEAALVASPASVRDVSLPLPVPGSPKVSGDVGLPVQSRGEESKEEVGQIGTNAAAVGASSLVTVPEPVTDAKDERVPVPNGKAEGADEDGDVKMNEAQEPSHDMVAVPIPDAAASDVPAPYPVDISQPDSLPSDWHDVLLSPSTPAPNGHFRDRSHSPDNHWRRATIWSRTPPREANGYAKTFEAKVELLDGFVPNGAVAPSHEEPGSPTDAVTRSQRAASPSPVTPRASPKLSHTRIPLVSQPSQEDGEIVSPPPPKALSLAPPRSHSPPTHPRHFYSSGGLSPTRPSPGSLSQSSARAPLHPAYHARNSPAAVSRLPPPAPPSAPRALRQGGAYSGSSYAGSGGGQNAPYYPPPPLPRGPSADRDRDRLGERARDWGRDRERDSDRVWHPGPSRGRGRGGSWR